VTEREAAATRLPEKSLHLRDKILASGGDGPIFRPFPSEEVAKALKGAKRVAVLDKNILEHLDGGAETETAGFPRQPGQELNENLEVRREEGVKVDESGFVERHFVDAGILELGGSAERRPVGVEELAQDLLAGAVHP